MPRINVVGLPVQEPPKKTASVAITEPEYKHSIVQSSDIPMGALLTQISGSSWTCDYYAQMLGTSESPLPFDIEQQEVYQQYQLIKGYELKLQGDLAQSYDSQTHITTITGTAIMYPYTRPNYGDMFVADVGDGKAGLFTITAVEEQSRYKQACYQIDFVMTKYMTSNLETAINERVVKKTSFIKNFMLYGQNPVVASSDKVQHDVYVNLIDDTFNDWLYEFYSNAHRTIVVPIDNEALFDPHLTKMILRVFDNERYPILANIVTYISADSQINPHTDVWSAIVERELYMLRNSFSDYTLRRTSAYSNNTHLQSIYYSSLDSIVAPVFENTRADERLGIVSSVADMPMPHNRSEAGSQWLPVFETQYDYVFSQGFYNSLPLDQLSVIERMVIDYLNARAISDSNLMQMVQSRQTWSPIERFYYVPVLVLLMISQTRSY